MCWKNILRTVCIFAACAFAQTQSVYAQKNIYIPCNYAAENVKAKFAADGPTLLFSDSPEMVYEKGILYRDTVSGAVRLFFHHVNAMQDDKKLAVLVKNANGLRPAAYKVLRRGVPEPSYNYLWNGKEAQQIYFGEQKNLLAGELGFGNAVEILSGRGVVLKPGQLLSGTLDLFFAEPLEVSVMLCEPGSFAQFFAETAKVLPQDEHPLRGTFLQSDWQYTLKESFSAPMQPRELKLAGAEEGYARGVDGTTQLAAENYGNYGVVYSVNFAVKGKKPISFIFNPLGGQFAGYGVLENATTGERKILALPESDLDLGVVSTDAVELAQLREGEYTFTWSPPGASNLPVRLIWRNAREKNNSAIKNE